MDRPSPRRLQDEEPPTASGKPQGKRLSGNLKTILLDVLASHLNFSNELAQRLVKIPVADNKDASVENRWRQLRDTVHSTALDVLDRARRQHQDCFDDNNASISNLLAKKNRLHKANVNRPIDANMADFY
ncbi:hypothetical protein SprV_0501840300 [Sparganum proliferum]